MRNVARLQEPTSLRENAPIWTRELLIKIKEHQKARTKVPDKLYNKYQQDDVRETLEIMYNGLCCYCESEVGVVEYGHIEHSKPKKKYPGEAFKWDNLHLACTRCNNKKGSKYSEEHPILDAVKDEIEKHMKYRIRPKGLIWWPLTKRGETTEGHVDLNRAKLPESRRDVFLGVMDIIDKINKKTNQPATNIIKRELEEMSDDVYGSVVKYAMNSFLKT